MTEPPVEPGWWVYALRLVAAAVSAALFFLVGWWARGRDGRWRD